MHYTISTPGQLIAELPHFFGFTPHRSLILLATSPTTRTLGPLVRIDLPAAGRTEDFRRTVTMVLRRLSDREFGELITVLMSAEWTVQGAAEADTIYSVCEEAAHQAGFTMRQCYLAANCSPGSQWVSLVTGDKGTVLPLPYHSHGEEAQRRSRTEAQQAMVAHILAPLAEWEAPAASTPQLAVLPAAQVHAYLTLPPVASVTSAAAVHLRQFLLRTIESCQGTDGLIALLAGSDAELWVGWMWALLPTLDYPMRSYVLLAVGMWHYMHGDGFRARTLLDQVAALDPHMPEVRLLQQLLDLCIDPADIQRVMATVARRYHEKDLGSPPPWVPKPSGERPALSAPQRRGHPTAE